MKSTDSALLAHLQGQAPPQPKWFSDAIAIEPEREWIDVDGAEIETLSWGQPGKPGLLFLHGNAAHADWWSFIAPFFQDDFRVVAFSWSGMGQSGWRKAYSIEAYADELHAMCCATGLLGRGAKPIVVAHSFASFPSFLYAATRGENLRGLVSLDTPLLTLAQRSGRKRSVRTGDDIQPHRVYPTEAAAITRYRFLPPQPSENLYIVDHVARKSLRRSAAHDPGGPGYAWSFDPYLWRDMTLGDPTLHVPLARCPLAFIRGGDSVLMTQEGRASFQRYAPPGSPILDIPAAHHHLMVDQPIALVCALQALLSSWPYQANIGLNQPIAAFESSQPVSL